MSLPPSRREFCAAAAAGLVAFQLAGCGSEPGPGDGGARDLARPGDLGAGDLASGPGCGPASSKDGGPASAVAAGQAQFTQDGRFFVCRDAKGLYALTSICTHNMCDVGFVSASEGFLCPCHGSKYDFNGQVTMGPAPLPLDHFSLCVAEDGEVFVDPKTIVDKTKRF